MTLSSISSATTPVYQTSDQQGMRTIRQLGRALQSGDLQGAQQAYATLSNLPQFQQALAAPTSRQSSFVQTLAQVGSDLQSGNLSAAQQSFSNLSGQSSQAGATGVSPTGGGHHHHHAHGASSSDSTDATDSADATSSVSSPQNSLLAILGSSDTSNAATASTTGTNPSIVPPVDFTI